MLPGKQSQNGRRRFAPADLWRRRTGSEWSPGWASSWRSPRSLWGWSWRRAGSRCWSAAPPATASAAREPARERPATAARHVSRLERGQQRQARHVSREREDSNGSAAREPARERPATAARHVSRRERDSNGSAAREPARDRTATAARRLERGQQRQRGTWAARERPATAARHVSRRRGGQQRQRRHVSGEREASNGSAAARERTATASAAREPARERDSRKHADNRFGASSRGVTYRAKRRVFRLRWKMGSGGAREQFYGDGEVVPPPGSEGVSWITIIIINNYYYLHVYAFCFLELLNGQVIRRCAGVKTQKGKPVLYEQRWKLSMHGVQNFCTHLSFFSAEKSKRKPQSTYDCV